MNEYESLSHTTWDCKYHVVFIPKCRRKTLYQELRRHLGEVFRRLAAQKEIEGRRRASDARSRAGIAAVNPDEIRRCSRWWASSRARARSTWPGFTASGNEISWGSTSGHEDSYVNTIGRDEEAIRAYIRNQEKEDQRLDQLNLWR